MRKALWSALGLLLVGAALAGGYLVYRARQVALFSVSPHGGPAPVRVWIPTGTGPRRLAQQLAEAGVVSDAGLFYAFIRREQAGPKLRAGEYEFEGPVTPAQVLAKILAGQVKLYRFTIPEGLPADEILPIIARSELKLDLKKLTTLSEDPSFLRKLGVPADRVEGFLYPDTYSFTRAANESAVLTKMVSRALEEYRAADARRAPSVGLDLLQTMTLASIVEKETGVPEERQRISCVFHNRLKRKMKLQTDPTVIYAMRLLRGTFSKNITSKDLVTFHPYNTYTVTGLPPGPIANPGRAAINAALNPLACNDLFFVSRNDGTHVFCPDLKCHNAAVEEWQRAYFRKQRRTKKGRG